MKRVIKTFIALTLVIALCIAPVSAFSDTPETHWSYPYVQRIQELGLLGGDGSGNFRPDEPISVAEFMALCCRLIGMDDKGLPLGQDHWAEAVMAFADYRDWYSSYDLMGNGYDQPLTRQFAAKILILALFQEYRSEVLPPNAASIADYNSIDPAYTGFVRRICDFAIMSTDPVNRAFRPWDSVTRADAAAILCRAWDLRCSIDPKAEIGESASVPILMYHHIAEEGDWAVSAADFRADLEELLDAGYTTILYQDLLDFVNGEGELPEKPVVITFDDGYASNYTDALPILKELNCKAEISVVSVLVGHGGENGVLRHFSWEEAREMQETGLVGIQIHSHAMHDWTDKRVGVLLGTDESYFDYIYEFSEDALEARTAAYIHLRTAAPAFTYPYGRHTAMTEKLLELLGYSITVTTEPLINRVARGDAASLRRLGRLQMDGYDGSVVAYIQSVQEETT